MVNGDARSTGPSARERFQHSALPALAVATGLALVYAGALAAFLLGAR